jgi:hypothetical protein
LCPHRLAQALAKRQSAEPNLRASRSAELMMLSSNYPSVKASAPSPPPLALAITPLKYIASASFLLGANEPELNYNFIQK